MTLVVAPSRLHFGLFHVPVESATFAPDGLPMRRFGGVGLMTEAPAIAVRAELAESWSAAGPHSERALAFAERFLHAYMMEPRSKARIVVEASPPEHVGLGVGTQLGMAVAKALTIELGTVMSPTALATAVGRGERSAIGVHGFSNGGLIVDAGKSERSAIGVPVVLRRFHPEWKIVLARPRVSGLWHGDRERLAFARRRDPEAALRSTERLCRLALLGLLPAVNEFDFASFSDAVYEFNRVAGEVFAEDQGGVYASAEVESIVDHVRSFGVRGVGQSSWGPTVFAFCPDQDAAMRLAGEFQTRFPALEDVTVTTASSGAS